MRTRVSDSVSKTVFHKSKKRKFSMNSMRHPLKRIRLGELLVARGYITPSQLKKALKVQKTTKKRLGTVFLESSGVSKFQLFDVLARQFVLRSMAAAVLGLVALTSCLLYTSPSPRD